MRRRRAGGCAGGREVKRSAAVLALMQRKTLLNDPTHEEIGLVNGHHTHLDALGEGEDEDGGGGSEKRHSLTRFDPEVSFLFPD